MTIQFGRIDSNDSQNWKSAYAEQTLEPNSFLSILNLLDVNTDGKTDTDELKFGAGFMVNSMIQAKDLNGDQALSAEEAGIPQFAAAQLDTDSSGTLSAKEIITPADKIIDGLVSVLDTDGDKALSPQELAIFEPWRT